jgi:hypothetical protein
MELGRSRTDTHVQSRMLAISRPSRTGKPAVIVTVT